ncbi:MAG: PD-(D/E)XK nuclease family protein, partial [Clostridia bacterium]|nr:PD-(D/E)XK nuclease family protein [Clostridia bacterium]
MENKIIKSNLRARMIPEIKKLSAVKDNITLCNELKSLTSNEKLQNILDQIATNCQSQNLNLREFITLFWTLCCSIKISNIPQFVDRVLIAPVNDWVPSRVDYLFIANCTTENFPKGQSDADILQEADLVGTQITPTPKIQRERNYRRAELLKSVAGCQLTLSGTHEDFEMVDYQPFNRFALPSLDCYCSPIKVGRDLFFLDNKVSTTSLEKYYQCPHFCFLQNGLKMTPRPLYHLEANTVGSAIHRALQEYVTLNQELKKQHKNTAENQVKIVNLAIKKGMQKLEYDYEPLTKNIEKEIRFIIQELAKIFATSKFQESIVETRVERKLEHDLTLVGKVDRVDYALLDNNERAFLVLDYKTGTVLDSVPTSIFIGNKLQLPIYSSILSDEFNHLAGAGYLPLSSGYATEKKEFNLKGFVNQSYADLLPVGLVKTKNSLVDDDTIAGIFYHANKMV